MSLQKIQTDLHAPKNQYNSFGKYNYRSCEDILTALKPRLEEHGYTLVISDEIVAVGDRVYVKATCTLSGDKGVISESNAYAREPLSKKGMDESQITGTASSYARKYALNGMFLIDDTKDADTNEQAKDLAKPRMSHDKQLELTTKAVNKAETYAAASAISRPVYQYFMDWKEPSYAEKIAELMANTKERFNNIKGES